MQLLTALHFPQLYQIQICEDLDDDVAASFSSLTLAHAPGGTTMLTGLVRDQAELHGLLSKICELNLTLLSVIT
jgi:hypothetical protein